MLADLVRAPFLSRTFDHYQPVTGFHVIPLKAVELSYGIKTGIILFCDRPYAVTVTHNIAHYTWRHRFLLHIDRSHRHVIDKLYLFPGKYGHSHIHYGFYLHLVIARQRRRDLIECRGNPDGILIYHNHRKCKEIEPVYL